MSTELTPFTKILKIIERIRESFDDAEYVYTNGSCVKFAMILKEIFPEGTILYDSNHAIFKYGNICYDITGIIPQTENHMPLENFGILHAYDIMKLKYESSKLHFGR